MILTITLNPLIERRYTYKNIELGKHHRNGSYEIRSGGKGINVSRQLNSLNLQNYALTFLGGQNGKTLRDELEKEKINSGFIKTQSETRDCSIIIGENEKSISAFFAPNSTISPNEVEEFISKLDKMIQNSGIIVFSGSSPCRETDIIFAYGIELANKYDKISVLDTYGEHLKNCIEKSPTILHNNFEELQTSLNTSLKSENEIFSLLDWLYGKGIKQSYVTNAEKPFFAANFDYHFKIRNPKITSVDSTGSGDSFVAGIVYSWYHNLKFEESLSIAASLGALNAASLEVSKVKLSEIDAVKKNVKIDTIGKKMKILDDTPR